MTRISKKAERKGVSRRKRRPASAPKTGPLKDNLPEGFRTHSNALEGEQKETTFIPTIR